MANKTLPCAFSKRKHALCRHRRPVGAVDAIAELGEAVPAPGLPNPVFERPAVESDKLGTKVHIDTSWKQEA